MTPEDNKDDWIDSIQMNANSTEFAYSIADWNEN